MKAKTVIALSAVFILVTLIVLAGIEAKKKPEVFTNERFIGEQTDDSFRETTKPQTYSVATVPISDKETEAHEVTEITSVKATEKEKSVKNQSFKEFWDEYENFVDSYVKVMNKPESKDYSEKMAQYKKYSDRAKEYENDRTLTDEELAYMTDAQARISEKIAEASLS